MTKSPVRVRFAPSPTGPLHIGGVRTALYNYLFARKHGGQFILRIEDTDQTRFVPGAEEYIIESLNWCGIQFDEGVHLGGPYAPYRQSERKHIYSQFAVQLVESGHAYYAFDSAEALESLRKKAESEKKPPFQYDVRTRNSLCNSLTLSAEEVQQRIASGEPYVIRYKIPENQHIEFYDLIRGQVGFDSNLLDDKVLFKSDGMPTYHLANVVDDYIMKITHVIRGEEWLPSAPLHVLLYRSLGWEKEQPEFAHLPLLLKPDGHGKLSKRDGDRLGFPVFPLRWTDPKNGEVSSGYRESGYFPEAFVNFLALLGWNPGTEQEIFSLNELINAFSIERIGKSGSRFDIEKARWFNQHYLQNKPTEELLLLLLPEVRKRYNTTPEFVAKALELVKNRMFFVSDFFSQAGFFFEAPKEFDTKAIKDKWKPDTGKHLLQFISEVENLTPFAADELHSFINHFIEKHQLSIGQFMASVRLSLVGKLSGPDVCKIMETLGKQETLNRLQYAVKTLG